MYNELLGRQSARAEARALLPLHKDGNTVEEVRDLIAGPSRIEKRLRAFALANP